MKHPTCGHPPCEKCGRPNTQSDWCNYCEHCHEEFNRLQRENAEAWKRQAEEYWKERGQ